MAKRVNIMNYGKTKIEVLQGDRVVNKIAGVNGIILAKDPNKEGRVILFSPATREKFISNVGLLVFVSRGRIPRNSGPMLDTSKPLYPTSFRTVHPFDQVVIHETHDVGIVCGINPDNTLEVVKAVGGRSMVSVHGVSLVKRDNGLMKQLKEVINA